MGGGNREWSETIMDLSLQFVFPCSSIDIDPEVTWSVNKHPTCEIVSEFASWGVLILMNIHTKKDEARRYSIAAKILALQVAKLGSIPGTQVP